MLEIGKAICQVGQLSRNSQLSRDHSFALSVHNE
uniref:Uncharacterized protein n=1 Tax=Arundo donax TaxID=35708 RepID=A0A0A9AJI9_ARUDO